MTIKVTHGKTSTRIHLTGAEAKAFMENLAAPATLYLGPAVTVTFKDQGQDFLEWDISEGKVVACRPFQASVWVGREVHSVPEPGKRLRITGYDGSLTYINYPLTKVKAMKAQVPGELSKAVLNSKVVTRGAKAILASYKKQKEAP